MLIRLKIEGRYGELAGPIDTSHPDEALQRYELEASSSKQSGLRLWSIRAVYDPPHTQHSINLISANCQGNKIAQSFPIVP